MPANDPQDIDFFMDESYDTIPDGKRFIITAFAVPASQWDVVHKHVADLRVLNSTPTAKNLEEFLRLVGGVCFIGAADIPNHCFPPKEKDSFADIQEMSRTDNVWSLCVTLTMASAVGQLLAGGIETQEIHVTYHQKTLKQDHRSQIGEAVKTLLSKIIQDHQPRFGYKSSPVITSFKEHSDKGESKEAHGIWIADRACRIFRKEDIPIEFRHFTIEDLSDVVLETLDRARRSG